MESRRTAASKEETAGGGEADLVARLHARDEAAFEELVRVHGLRMLAVARRFLAREDDAQDAVQDAFLSAYRAVPSFSGASRLGTWLHRIVVNAALMKLRTRRRRPESTLDGTVASAWEASAVAPPGRGSMSSAQSMAQAETRARVRECIASIPEDYRTVLLLCDIEGMKISEACHLLEVSAGTVKMRLHRARHHMRKLLDPFMKEDAP